MAYRKLFPIIAGFVSMQSCNFKKQQELPSTYLVNSVRRGHTIDFDTVKCIIIDSNKNKNAFLVRVCRLPEWNTGYNFRPIFLDKYYNRITYVIHGFRKCEW
jgi:hypothetical protein